MLYEVITLDDVLTTPGRRALFERLRGWRSEQAKAQDVPPYVSYNFV